MGVEPTIATPAKLKLNVEKEYTRPHLFASRHPVPLDEHTTRSAKLAISDAVDLKKVP